MNRFRHPEHDDEKLSRKRQHCCCCCGHTGLQYTIRTLRIVRGVRAPRRGISHSYVHRGQQTHVLHRNEETREKLDYQNNISLGRKPTAAAAVEWFKYIGSVSYMKMCTSSHTGCLPCQSRSRSVWLNVFESANNC